MHDSKNIDGLTNVHTEGGIVVSHNGVLVTLSITLTGGAASDGMLKETVGDAFLNLGT